MAFQSGLFYFHHDLEGSHDTDMQAHLCVEHTGILDVLGLQLDLFLSMGEPASWARASATSLPVTLPCRRPDAPPLALMVTVLPSIFAARSLAAATVSASWKSAAASLLRATFTALASATAASLAREQVVAGVAVGDLVDLVLLTDALDILLQNHFHGVIPHFSPGNRWISMASIQQLRVSVNGRGRAASPGAFSRK